MLLQVITNLSTFLPWSCWTLLCPVFANSVDPDQLASSEANWSGYALFVIQYVNLYKKQKTKQKKQKKKKKKKNRIK